ncbi:MAG TPA: VOC family protein [Vicinamibacterales bacterium]
MIDPATRIGAVHLTVASLDRSIRFYQSRLGFAVHRRKQRTAWLGAGGQDLLILTEEPGAARSHGTTGLYHFAILVPSRLDLARSLRRLVSTETAMQGAADHGVSEALYLADEDGNGIEIYRDRPRSEWPYVDGRLHMGSGPLDFHNLLDEPGADPDDQEGLAATTVIGHVHLHVPHLEAARRFYVDVLGMELMQRYGPSALFVSAGGYHHHVGLNTWAGVGAPPPPPGAIGLRYFEVTFGDTPARTSAIDRLQAAGFATESAEHGLSVGDPAGNTILLTSDRH